jgi:hypothetical protein
MTEPAIHFFPSVTDGCVTCTACAALLPSDFPDAHESHRAWHLKECALRRRQADCLEQICEVLKRIAESV